MSVNLLVKKGYCKDSVIQRLSDEDCQGVLASPHIMERLNKFANTVQAIAPRSDDFLYFTIIFLKAAEAALIDKSGSTKVLDNGERAWGYFDENHRWHGNVKPHKNANSDIFSESELKKATRKWIGRPLCVDHKSDAVDGIRGVILDTYYDEKLKQVVGLCALDRVNYPELAHKVKSGVVRYGSMGTAVEISICTECGQQARNANEYCDCIRTKRAWGEVNVGLKPIEYSLVVQPAEPGAILLRCLASIGEHERELESYGMTLDQVKELDEKQASDLDLLLHSVCGENGCSLETRERIISGFIHTNGFSKAASKQDASEKVAQDATKSFNRDLLADLTRFEDAFGIKYQDNPELYHRVFGDELSELLQGGASDRNMPTPQGEVASSGQNAQNSQTITMKDDGDVRDYTGTGSSTGLVGGVSEPNPDSFRGDGGVGPEHYAFAKQQEPQLNDLKKITEEIMNESRRRKRAEWRRRLAHPQGGSEGREPNTYKNESALNENIREKQDKQMLQDGPMGGPDGLVPGDKEKKEKLSRADEEESAELSKQSYHQGGSAPAVEPNVYQSTDYKAHWMQDKQMLQDGSMGGSDGMVPGDKEKKEKLSRAKYEGPALSTKIKQRRTLDGSINKAASSFEVYSGDQLIIATTAQDILGDHLDDKWDVFASEDYSRNVIATIREKGVDYVGRVLTGQDLSGLPQEAPLEEPMPEGELLNDEGPEDMVEEALELMEDGIEQLREAVMGLGLGEADMPEDKLALSNTILLQLKEALADSQSSADELALLAETCERKSALNVEQHELLRKTCSETLHDSAEVRGRSEALISIARKLSELTVKTSTFVEEDVTTGTEVAQEKTATEETTVVAAEEVEEVVVVATEELTDEKVTASEEDEDMLELKASALELRRNRRRDLLKKAMEHLSLESAADDSLENAADDSLENAADDVLQNAADDSLQNAADDTTQNAADDSLQNVADDSLQNTAEDALQNAAEDALQNAADDTVQNAAEDALQNAAEDMSEIHEIAESEAEEEVEKHEDAMHKEEEEEEEDKESDSNDALSAIQAKLSDSFTKKKAEEEREAYKVRLRRAYDVAMEMQRKGMLAPTKPALNNQVDLIMEFDDRAFESFKRTVANTRQVDHLKTASDLNGVNVGLNDEANAGSNSSDLTLTAENLSKLWD